MQSVDFSPADAQSPTVSDVAARSTVITAGWFVRRMVLWVLFVGLGIAGACLLYMAASKAEAEAIRRNAGDQAMTSTLQL